MTYLLHVRQAAAALGEVTIAHISLGGLPEKPEVFSLRRVGRDSTIPMGGSVAPSRGTDFSGQMGSAATGVIPSRGYGGCEPPRYRCHLGCILLRCQRLLLLTGRGLWLQCLVRQGALRELEQDDPQPHAGSPLRRHRASALD